MEPLLWRREQKLILWTNAAYGICILQIIDIEYRLNADTIIHTDMPSRISTDPIHIYT